MRTHPIRVYFKRALSVRRADLLLSRLCLNAQEVIWIDLFVLGGHFVWQKVGVREQEAENRPATHPSGPCRRGAGIRGQRDANSNMSLLLASSPIRATRTHVGLLSPKHRTSGRPATWALFFHFLFTDAHAVAAVSLATLYPRRVALPKRTDVSAAVSLPSWSHCILQELLCSSARSVRYGF